MRSRTSRTFARWPAGLLAALFACAHGGAGTGASKHPEDGEPLVTAEDIQRNPTVPIEQLLMAKVPGVWVTRTPDGGLAIRIRGATSINESNAPLYVVDGTAVDPGPYGDLVGINPYEIASLRVLKDAAAMSMYGTRGANGVVLIRLKQP